MKFKSERKVQPELVAAKDESRPVLTKVHLDVEKSQVTVTDSYMLARFPVEVEDGDTSGPVPVDALKASRKPPAKYGDAPSIHLNSHAQVAQGEADPYLTVPRESADYQFPNAEQLIPEKVAEFKIGLNATKLLALAKAMGLGPNDAIEIAFTEHEGAPSNMRPIHVRPAHAREGDPDGILMPLRLG